MKKLSLTEDWTATIIGGLVIVLGIILYSSFGYTLSWPTFKWSTGDDLYHFYCFLCFITIGRSITRKTYEFSKRVSLTVHSYYSCHGDWRKLGNELLGI